MNKAFSLASQAWTKSQNCKHSRHYYESVIALGRAYYQRDLGDSVIILLKPVLEEVPENVPVFYKASMHQRLSSAYIMISQLEEGLKEGLKALKGFETIKDTGQAATVMSNIALVYQQQNNFKQADYYLRMAEAKAKPLASKVALGTIYNTMGILYAEHDQYDSAAKFFEQSTVIREKLNDNTSVVWNYNNLGGLYVYMKKYDLGILYLNKALDKFKELGNDDGQTSVVNNLGELYLNLGNYPKALEYFTYSRQLYAKTHTPEYLEILYTNFSSYYKKTGDFKLATFYSDSLVALKDSLYGNRLDQSI
ncbi:MAG: tetratricopeptide repeat protein, partial [Bacteroidia bacterium]|nr:tetratricopeptide repeat protein [Bacteroidia bacterium]